MKRFEQNLASTGSHDAIVEADDGDYVMHSDHVAVVETLKAHILHLNDAESACERNAAWLEVSLCLEEL